MAGSRYAPGTRAWGLCKKCGLRFLLRDLVFDGYYPGLRVCNGCYDDKQPQEFLIDVTDPEALWKPSPEDGPSAPILTGYASYNTVYLNWTQPELRGQPRVENYQLFRAQSSDDGITYTPFTLVHQWDLVYYGAPTESLADLVENGNPVFNNGGIASGLVLAYEDVVGTDLTTFYMYQVIANLSYHEGDEYQAVPSNRLVLQMTYYHAIDFMHAGNPDLAAGTLIFTVEFSSRPYPVQDVEQWHAGNPTFPPAPQYEVLPDMFNSGNAALSAGTLNDVVQNYDNWLLLVADETFHAGVDGLSGTLNDVLLEYTNWPLAVSQETYHSGNATLSAGTLLLALIQYENWPAETFHSGNAQLTAGTLT